MFSKGFCTTSNGTELSVEDPLLRLKISSLSVGSEGFFTPAEKFSSELKTSIVFGSSSHEPSSVSKSCGDGRVTN